MINVDQSWIFMPFRNTNNHSYILGEPIYLPGHSTLTVESPEFSSRFHTVLNDERKNLIKFRDLLIVYGDEDMNNRINSFIKMCDGDGMKALSLRIKYGDWDLFVQPKVKMDFIEKFYSSVM